ncbi:hypothetical protein Tco_1198748, partial [Tanacetum coccineum]
LAVRHSADHSSSDSSSKASSDFHSDASSDSYSRHSLSDHSSSDLLSTSAGPSRKRCRSLMTSVPALSPVFGVLSLVCADLIPSPKRVKDSGYLADVEVDPKEMSLRDDAIAEIDECFAYTDALRDRGIDARVVVEAVDQDETETGMRGPIEVRVERVTHPVMPEDIPEPAQEGAVEVIEEVQREQGHRIVGVESVVTALTERIAKLERDNRRLSDTVSVKSQRVDRLQRGPLNENGDEQEGEDGGNGNGGNGGDGNGGNGGNGNGGNGENRNENRNGNHGMNYGGFMPVARECTFQDFLKCKPQNLSGTEGVVGLTRWFEKMETVFNISNCPPKYQVKYATCTLQDSALTWFQELILLCTRMVPDEEDKVERFIGGLPDNIQWNVIAGYAARSAENKKRMESNLRDNRGQQPSFTRQNTSGQNVARAYTAGNNERKGYDGSLPYCNKCRLHHEGLCTMRCGNCKKVGHQTRECRAAI